MNYKCVVCGNEDNKNTYKCKACGFTEVNKIFVTKEDRDYWIDTVVKPYYIQWKRKFFSTQKTIAESEVPVINEIKIQDTENTPDFQWVDVGPLPGQQFLYNLNEKPLPVIEQQNQEDEDTSSNKEEDRLKKKTILVESLLVIAASVVMMILPVVFWDLVADILEPILQKISNWNYWIRLPVIGGGVICYLVLITIIKNKMFPDSRLYDNITTLLIISIMIIFLTNLFIGYLGLAIWKSIGIVTISLLILFIIKRFVGFVFGIILLFIYTIIFVQISFAPQWYFNNNDNVIKQYGEIIRNNPNYAHGYSIRGQAFNKKGLYNEAIIDLTKAIRLRPNFAIAYGSRGSSYNNEKNYDLAINDFDRAIQFNHNNATWYNDRGWAYYNKNKYEQALADFNQAIQLSSNFAMAYNNRGNVYRDQGDLKLAIEDYKIALRIDPNHPYARQSLEKIQQISGQ